MPSNIYRMRFLAAMAACLLLWAVGNAQDKSAATVTVSSLQINAGDTVFIDLQMHDASWQKMAITLNVWIEDVHRSSHWRLRYPVMAGLSEAAIVFPKGMTSDFYALHFSVQSGFFDAIGQINSKYKDDSIAFTMVSYKSDIMFGALPVRFGNQFRLGKILFEQSSYIFFSDYRKSKKRITDISVVAPLDSPFVSLYDTTLMLQLGDADRAVAAAGYQFDKDEFLNPGGTLENVTVTAARRTKTDKLEEDYVSNGLFKSSDAILFDGDDPVLQANFNALNYLQGRVPGLTIGTSEDGQPSLSWRGSATALFVDEMQMTPDVLTGIPTSNIALIKVFRPPFFGAFGGGPGGAVAIYTRKGTSYSGTSSGVIVLNGYTPQIYALPIGEKNEPKN